MLTRRDALKAIAALPLVASGELPPPAPAARGWSNTITIGTIVSVGGVLVGGTIYPKTATVEICALDIAHGHMVVTPTGRHVGVELGGMSVKPGARCAIRQYPGEPWRIVAVAEV